VESFRRGDVLLFTVRSLGSPEITRGLSGNAPTASSGTNRLGRGSVENAQEHGGVHNLLPDGNRRLRGQRVRGYQRRC